MYKTTTRQRYNNLKTYIVIKVILVMSRCDSFLNKILFNTKLSTKIALL